MDSKRNNLIYNDETLDDLILGGLKLIQASRGYRFSLDAVLLAHFPELKENFTIVDLGTGNGVIPVLLLTRSPHIKITGLEIQEHMVDRAKRTIKYNHLEEQIEIIEGNIKDINAILPKDYADLVVSNPPFWKKEEGKLSENEEEAVARHEITVDLKSIVSAGSYILRDGGKMCIIHRADRLPEIIYNFEQNHLRLKRLRTVHPFHDREAKLILAEGQKNGRGGFTILPPLIVYKQPGEYCDELKQLYQIS